MKHDHICPLFSNTTEVECVKAFGAEYPLIGKGTMPETIAFLEAFGVAAAAEMTAEAHARVLRKVGVAVAATSAALPTRATAPTPATPEDDANLSPQEKLARMSREQFAAFRAGKFTP